MILIEFVLFLVMAFVLKMKFEMRRLREMVDKFDGPPALPFLGNIFMLVGTPREMFKSMHSCYTKYQGQAFRLWLLHKPCVIVSSIEDIRIVSKIPQKDEVYEYLTSILGDGLITNKGRKWKRSRRILDPLFNSAAVGNNFLEIFNRQSWQLAENLERKAETEETFDLWPFIFRMSLQTIYETAVGSKIRVNDDILFALQDGILKACHLAFKRCYQPWLQPSIIFNAYLRAKGYGNVFQDIMQFHRKMIADKKKFLNDSNVRTEDDHSHNRSVMDALLQGQETDQFSDADIANEIVTLLFAGTETSSVIVCFTLMMLASHTRIQEKVYREIREKTGRNENAAVTMKDLSELTYLEQCIKETMRKFSIVPLLLRQSPDDVTLKNGMVIPAGVTIAMSPYLVHHDVKYYDKPHDWDPSNFDAEKVACRPAYSFIPFGTGPRTCLGNKYGMISMKVSLVVLLRRFVFATTQTRFKLDHTFMTRCANGYHLRIQRRKYAHPHSTIAT